mgnify:CR=1 FL=1
MRAAAYELADMPNVPARVVIAEVERRVPGFYPTDVWRAQLALAIKGVAHCLTLFTRIFGIFAQGHGMIFKQCGVFLNPLCCGL